MVKLDSKQTEHSTDDDNKFFTAMNYAKNVCILGASNKVEDIAKTTCWSYIQKYRYCDGSFKKYHKDANLKIEDNYFNIKTLDHNTGEITADFTNWYYAVDHPELSNKKSLDVTYLNNHPLQFIKKDEHQELLLSCLYALATRYGNCGHRAALVGKYLWEHSEGVHRIEGIKMKSFDHIFVVVNRSGELNKPETWGNAKVIDAWYQDGIIFEAKDVRKMVQEMKEYVQYQSEQFKEKKFGNMVDIKPDGKELFKCSWEILPASHTYPTHVLDKNKQIEDYYEVLNVYPKNIRHNINQFEKIHKGNFSKCLTKINSGTFFQKNKLKEINDDTHFEKKFSSQFLDKNLSMINQQDDEGFTSLHFAAMNNDSKLLQWLLQNKANLSATTKKGHSALFFAALNGHTNIVKVLLKYDADVEAQTFGLQHQSALQIACLSPYTLNHPSLFLLLLKAKASLTYQDDNHETAYDIAVKKNNQTASNEIIAFALKNKIGLETIMSSSNIIKYNEHLSNDRNISKLHFMK